MTIQYARSTPPPAKIAVADAPSILAETNAPRCVVAVWRRHPLASFQTWLNQLCPTVLPQARLILRPETVNDALSYVCDQAGTPDCHERDMLTGDIAALAQIFAEVAACDYLRLRLGPLKDAQELTGQDIVNGKRLICVYRGPELAISDTKTCASSETTVANGAPFIACDDGPDEVITRFLFCSARASSLVLTIDPVSTSEETSDHNNIAYH